MNKTVLLGCSAVVALATCAGLEAATIRGRVLDSVHDAVLPGATVTIAGTATVVTDRDGRFELQGVTAGSQQVTIDYVGFRRSSETMVAAEAPAPVDIRLTPEVSGSDIVITGTLLADARALQTKRSDNRVVEALYANDVGKLPDQNVAEAVKRLPGVTVANDQGEGRYVVIRGIDPNLVNVSVNGQTMPAPEPGGRVVKLDDIPSAMIGSVVVAKSILPDQDANAIGGEVNIRTLSAFDRNKKRFFDARGAYGYYHINGKNPWEADAQAGGLFGAEEQFGAVVSANYSRRPIESQNYQGSTAWVATPNGSLVPNQNGLRDYNLIRTRLGLVGNLDWRASDRASLWLRSSYSRFTDNEWRDQNRIDNPGNYRNQTATSGTVDGRGSVLIRRRQEKSNTKSVTLGGNFDMPVGELSMSGGWTKAVKLDPLRSEFTFRTGSSTVKGISYDLLTSPYLFTPEYSGNANDYKFYKLNVETRQSSETIWQGAVDYKAPLPLGEGSMLKVGAKYLDRTKINNQDRTNYNAGTGAFTLTDVIYAGKTGFYDGLFSFGPRANYDAGMAFVAANPKAVTVDTAGSISDSLANDFRVKERIIAGYAMLDLKFGDFTLIPGVRVESTRDRMAGKIVNKQSQLADGYNSFGAKSYTNFFPGVTARYDLGRRMVIRGAVTTSIGRPNYSDLSAYINIDNGASPVAITRGNPDLKPLKAVNLDAAVEYYLPGQGVLSAGVFYKHIDNPIYARQSTVSNGVFAGQTIPLANVTMPVNVNGANISGIELNAQTRFTFLRSPFDGLGVSVNYTHVAGHANGYQGRGDIPLANQSRDSGTAQLFYEKHGFALRLAYSYRSRYLDTLGDNAATDQYTDSNGQLDMHVSYQILPQVTVFGDATNLTDAPWRRYIGNKAFLVERERYDYSLRGGVQVHF
jgi:TonB-dependent receptor